MVEGVFGDEDCLADAGPDVPHGNGRLDALIQLQDDDEGAFKVYPKDEGNVLGGWGRGISVEGGWKDE